MQPTNRDERGALLAAIVSEMFAKYGKVPTTSDFEVWERSVGRLPVDKIERAIAAHIEDSDDGKRMPRPVDILRRSGGLSASSGGCCFTGCAYPGVMSETTTGGGQWFCPYHFHNRAGQDAHRYAEESQAIPYADAVAYRVRAVKEAQKHSPHLRILREQMAAHRGNAGRFGASAMASLRQPGEDDSEAA